jgi:hypothetical protein
MRQNYAKKTPVHLADGGEPRMTPFGEAGEKATGALAQREHAEAHYAEQEKRNQSRMAAERNATTHMEGGVRVTRYPTVTPNSGGRSGAGNLLHEMNPQKLN